MNSHPRRPPDPLKQWALDHDPDRRRNRSATLPAHAYDPRSHDARYNEPSRSHRQDPSPSHSYHHSSAHAPRAATRPSAQHPHHHPQPSSYHTTPAYPAASSSRRPHPEAPDPRTSRRPAHPPYGQPSGGEEMARASGRPSRAVHSSIQPSLSAPPNQTFWIPPQETPSSRRPKDPYRDRDRNQERERDRDRDKPAELENRYKRADRYREREPQRATEVRYQESTRSRHHDRRKDSDTQGVMYSEQRNASKASLSGREGYSSSVRESGNGHKRHRTEDGTASSGRRHHPENTQNPITTMPSQSTSVPQPDVQQTGEPPPAPRVMPVYLPPKAKSQRSHREPRPSTAQGAQSGSDTERGKHRMERTPSGPAVQRSDAHTATRDRGNHDLPMGPRDDVKRVEAKYGMHQDTRQPLAPINVDIPLVTPRPNASALPTETRASTIPQIVSLRAGQGPDDPHDAHFKSSAVSHSDAPQEFVIHPPHPTSASIVKSSGHTRSQPSETRAQSDRPPVTVEHSRIEPRGGDLPPGQRMSIHESSRAFSKSYARGNPETGVDIANSSYPHSRPPSRSAHRISTNNAVPPAVVGPRPLRSVSQGPQTNEPPTRPPSVAHHVPPISSIPSQHSVPPSPAHPANGSPPNAGYTHGLLSSAQPSPKYAQLHGVSPSHSTSAQQAPSVPPSVHPTPIIVPQPLTASSRPSTRDGTYTAASYTRQQSADQQPTTDNHLEFQQTSNSTTVKASWVVQTPVTAKISREDKYLRDNHFDLETPQAQLRQVLSQDDDPFPRASSSMMKASQAMTPPTSSQRNSPGTKARDVPFGTPRGTLASNSPRSGSAKEAPTPEHVPRQNLSLHLAGPPQIAVVGATPVTMARDLPQGRVDHALLVPHFPAPTRVSRTTSSSQDQQSQPSQLAARNTLPTSYQPQLAPAVHAPSLFQPYRPPSPPTPEDSGQFSPPPLPIPPPRGLEDSPPPPIETRASEIIPTRSQSDGHPQSYVHFVPEVQSEMFHLPSQASAPSQPPSVPSPRATETWQPGKVDNNTVPMATSNGSVVHGDAWSSKPAFAQPDDVQVAHQEIMRSISVLPSQSSVPPTRPRPKVTIEDVPEDSPVSSKGIPMSMSTITPSVPVLSRPVQPSQHTTVANANSMSKAAAVDQPSQNSSPQSRSKDPPLHRNTEPSAMLAAPPMPSPTPAAAPTPTRVPSSAPPTQPTFSLSAQAAPAQRAASHTVSSRIHQRAAEMLQTSKLSTSVGTSSGAIGSGNKSTAAPVQTTYNPVSTAPGQQQPANGASVQSPWVSRLVNTPTSTAPHHNASATASTTKVAAPTTTIGSGPPVGAPGPHIAAPPTSINTQPPFAPDPSRHQPSRPGPLSIPSIDAASTTVMSTTAVKTHQEQPTVDSTRPRDATPSTIRNPSSSSHIYPTSTRPATSPATTQQTHVTPAQPSTHYRAVSLPITSSSSVVQKPPSPRKYSQPISSTTVSAQPFPSRPSAPESQSTRAPVSGHVSNPAPVRSARLPFPDRTNDVDMLKTPSSIAPSPMLNPDTSNTGPQSIAIPIRARQASTDSKDDKKKASGLFGLFRARTLSSKAADPVAVSTATRASLDQGRSQPGTSVVAPTTTPVSRGVTSTSAPKELHSAPPPVVPTSIRTGSRSGFKGKVADPTSVPPPMQTAREHKDTTPHIFTPFKFLSMHSKRNRTVSAASLDVCDGNTATNTVVGSPDHSTVGQAQPLPAIIPPDVRDPLVAASEWRDREEAERRERRTHRIRRPGVTFDVEEEPPSPAPGTANKRKKLVRRPSGRAPTPAPPRS